MFRLTGYLLFFIIFLLVFGMGHADEKQNESAYQFSDETRLPHTAVKSQDSTGTCWCFSTVSFLESELMRLGKGEYNLSEMYIVRHTYPRKADNYIRMHGAARFGQGGLSHDVLETFRLKGIVPEEAYPGKSDDEYYDHREMEAVLLAMLDAVLEKHGTVISPHWDEAVESVLNVYLGTPPGEFQYKGKKYTPQSFAQSLNLNPDDYVEITSYTHHPFYRKIRLEIPDNWSYYDEYYNLPLDAMEQVADHALKNGYTLVWDGDVSEDYYEAEEAGVAVVPVDSSGEQTGDSPVAEMDITPEYRQKTFDNLSTTDDHLMHLIGTARDQNGTKYYIVKDSWDSENVYNGYIYLSRSYFRLKTTGLMLHRDGLPDEVEGRMKDEG